MRLRAGNVRMCVCAWRVQLVVVLVAVDLLYCCWTWRVIAVASERTLFAFVVVAGAPANKHVVFIRTCIAASRLNRIYYLLK